MSNLLENLQAQGMPTAVLPGAPRPHSRTSAVPPTVPCVFAVSTSRKTRHRGSTASHRGRHLASTATTGAVLHSTSASASVLVSTSAAAPLAGDRQPPPGAAPVTWSTFSSTHRKDLDLNMAAASTCPSESARLREAAPKHAGARGSTVQELHGGHQGWRFLGMEGEGDRSAPAGGEDYGVPVELGAARRRSDISHGANDNQRRRDV
ncbi:hypothetical protein U9M48_029369 [Paspalum notatum var. saurae]|uniref:Uncharacterized protein n=1 Tax=Paspalum notatum var. saurae TaxID=547442 RepID=A0AAQ3X1G8_PASNO